MNTEENREAVRLYKLVHSLIPQLNENIVVSYALMVLDLLAELFIETPEVNVGDVIDGYVVKQVGRGLKPTSPGYIILEKEGNTLTKSYFQHHLED